jgi:mono/diheme cytochrome c family protein
LRNAARTWLAALTALALQACLEDPPQREPDQWPIARTELTAAAAKLAGPLSQPGGAADPGEAAYRKTCIACHGADGKGNGGKTAADFSSPVGPLKKQDAVLLTSIAQGATGPIGVMPPHKALLSEADIAAVLAYVRRTFGTGITPDATPPADAGMPAP